MQRGVGEPPDGSLLLKDAAIQQCGRAGDRVSLHHEQLTLVHDIKNKVEVMRHSTDQAGQGN